jgi:hypothetical protein
VRNIFAEFWGDMSSEYVFNFTFLGFKVYCQIRKKSFDDRIKQTFRLIDDAVTPEKLQIAQDDYASYSVGDRANNPALIRASVLLNIKIREVRRYED